MNIHELAVPIHPKYISRIYSANDVKPRIYFVPFYPIANFPKIVYETFLVTLGLGGEPGVKCLFSHTYIHEIEEVIGDEDLRNPYGHPR